MAREDIPGTTDPGRLTGRPWRFVSPALGLAHVNIGWEGDLQRFEILPGNRWVTEADASAFAIRELSRTVNENRMYFDLHLHYKSVDDASNALSRLVDPTAPWASDVPDDAHKPEQVVVLEFGPKGDTDEDINPWWNANKDQFQLYQSTGDQPVQPWEDFIKEDTQFYQGWEAGQFGSVGDFSMASLLSQLDVPSYAAVCYGPTKQGANMGEVFAIAALWANYIYECGNYTHPDEWIVDDQKFTPIRGDYQNAAGSHQITNDFTPHDTACDPDYVCPPCPDQ